MVSIDISQMVMTIVVVCLILWRMSYGMENGLFAEAAGLIAVIAAFFAVYYSMRVVDGIVNVKIGKAVSTVGYFIIAFLVYKVMTAIADALRRVKDIPIIGSIDRLLGAVLGVVEACLMVLLVEYVTNIEIMTKVISSLYNLVSFVSSFFIKK